MNKSIQWHLDLVRECLVLFGDFTAEEAEERLRASGLLEWAPRNTDLFYHEEIYFWAMEVKYGREDPSQFWFHNENLWPPPDDYRQWIYKKLTSDL